MKGNSITRYVLKNSSHIFFVFLCSVKKTSHVQYRNYDLGIFFTHLQTPSNQLLYSIRKEIS